MLTPNKSKILIMLVIVGLLITMLPAGAFAATKCDTTYEVKRGDTLATIGKKFGYAANQIVYASKLGKPNYTIYVGQRLCIPDGKNSNAPAVDSKYTNKAAAYFTAGRTTDSVLIYAFNYPKTNVIIKGASAPNTERKFYEIGKLALQNNKAFKYKLPAELKNVKTLQVCLKDRTTSYLQCVNVRPK